LTAGNSLRDASRPDHRRHHGPGDQPHRAYPGGTAGHHQRRTRPLRRVDHPTSSCRPSRTPAPGTAP